MALFRWVGLIVALALALTGCGLPRDPDGTLERARARGELVVGVSPSPPTLVVEDGAASGWLVTGDGVVAGAAAEEGAAGCAEPEQPVTAAAAPAMRSAATADPRRERKTFCTAHRLR